MEKTFTKKDKMRDKALTECRKGVTSCETKRGKVKSYGKNIETQYGTKPRAYK